MSGTDTEAMAPSSTWRRVRLEGILDMVRASDATFSVRLGDGREVHCRLVGRRIETLARLLNQPAVFFGTAPAETSGPEARTEVDGFLPENSLLERPLDPYGQTAEERQEMAQRLRVVMGSWPGDETDNKIDEALRELS